MTPSFMPARIASIRARSRDLLPELARDVLHRVVERPRDDAELVVAKPEPRRREIAAAVALGDAGDQPDAPSNPRREYPGDRRAAGEREAERGDGGVDTVCS